MKREEFMREFVCLLELYNTKYSEGTLNMYFRIMEEFDIEDFRAAIVEVLKNKKYNNFPKPNEFIEAIKKRSGTKYMTEKEKEERIQFLLRYD